MPLAGAIAINFSAPLWAALVAILVAERAGGIRPLGRAADRLSRRRRRGQPGADSLTLGAVFALLNAVMLGSVTAAVRVHVRNRIDADAADVAARDRIGLPFAVAAVGREVGAAGRFRAVFLLRPRQPGGAIFLTKSLTLAPTTAVSPFFYFMLVWAIGIAFVVVGRGSHAPSARRIGHRGGGRALSLVARGEAARRSGGRVIGWQSACPGKVGTGFPKRTCANEGA